jgi:hypothetical protein
MSSRQVGGKARRRRALRDDNIYEVEEVVDARGRVELAARRLMWRGFTRLGLQAAHPFWL